MATIQCSGVMENGSRCIETFQTSEPISPKATFSCRLHTNKSTREWTFQASQFDPDINRPVDVLRDEIGNVDASQRRIVKIKGCE